MTNQLVQDHGITGLLFVSSSNITQRTLDVTTFGRDQTSQEDAEAILRIMLERLGGVGGRLVQILYFRAEMRS